MNATVRPLHARHNSLLQFQNSAYEAGGHGRRLSPWGATSAGPNTVTDQSQILRNRSRDAARNNPWIANSIRQWTADECGTAIQIRSRAPDDDFREQINELWERWGHYADADGSLNIDGLIALLVRNRVEAGEVFLRRRIRRNSRNGLPVPLQVQAIEAEQCPNDFDAAATNRRIKQGIEFDRRGQRLRYWLYAEHPSDYPTALNAGLRIAVPARDVIHHYAPLRPGQIRGVPWTLQALIKARDFDQYDDAELERKKIRANYTGVIRRAYPTYVDEQQWRYDPFTGEPVRTDMDGAPIMRHEPGSFPALEPGEDVTLFDGDETGNGYADFVRQQIMGIASASGIPYEVISGDWGKVNDRIARVILNQYHRVIEQSQWHLTIPQVLRPLWAWFVDAAVMSGAVSAPGYAERREDYLKAEFQPEGWPYVHPVQDIDAAIKAINGGLDSRSRWVAQRGWDATDIDTENSQDRNRAESLGLDYTTLPSPTEHLPFDEDDEA